MRIAIVGAGPTGFFLAAALLKSGPADLTIDMFEKTAFPFGLVRFGVAPDHPKIKSVTKGFQKTMDDPRFSFFGQITLAESQGTGHITTPELLGHYDRVVLTVGCQDDRKLDIEGEDGGNSFSATRFVGWYNGHPEDLELNPNLQVNRATVVGAGNVAIDVFRFLASPHDRMSLTDASDHSLESLKSSTIKEIDVLVRRGAWDVAFTNPEVKELLDFEDIQFNFSPALPPLAEVPAYADKRAVKNMEVFHDLAQREVAAPRMTLNFHFQVSPERITVDAQGAVSAVELVHNDLEFGETGSKITVSDRRSDLPTELFIRSVGYRGRALAGVPFKDNWGLIPSDDFGRVLGDDESPLAGLYVSGWMRRGPSGVIGTNKKDAQDVANTLLEDKRACALSDKEQFRVWRAALAQHSPISKEDWGQLDLWELSEGEKLGKPRRKLVSAGQVAEALARLSQTSSSAG